MKLLSIVLIMIIYSCDNNLKNETQYSRDSLEVKIIAAMSTKHCPNKVPQYHCAETGCDYTGKAPTTSGVQDCILTEKCPEHR